MTFDPAAPTGAPMEGAGEPAAPAPIQLEPGAIPPAPPTGVDPSAAVAFYQSIADPGTRNPALERTLQQYGVLPEGMGLDQMRAAVEFMRSIPDGVPVEELQGFAQEYAEWQSNPFAGQQQVDPGQQVPQGQPPFDPQQMQQWMDQRIQAGIQQGLAGLQTQQREQEFREGLGQGFQQAIHGMAPGQAEMLEDLIGGRVNRFVQGGGQLSAAAAAQIIAESRQLLQGMGAVAGAQQQADQFTQTPNTQVPSGAPQGGNAYAPGLEGAAQRARELIAQSQQR